MLALSHIRFTSDEARAFEQLEQRKDTYPERVEQHEFALETYQERVKHYEKMLELYRTDRNEYIRLVEGKYEPPSMPFRPRKPEPPELDEKFYELNAQFRARKNHYFAVTSRLTWVALLAALGTVGGLVYLLMFDEAGTRWHYLALLLISFVFLIGPSFHSILTTVMGFMQAPAI